MFDLPKYGNGICLARMAELLEILAIDRVGLQRMSVVVTGSNGKGSTAAFSASIARAYGLRKRNRLCSTAAADIENVFARRHFQSLQQPAIKIDRGICAIDLDAFFEKLCLRSPLRSILIVASSHIFIS